MAGVPEKPVIVVEGREVAAVFTTNALCEIEEQFDGRSIASIGEQLSAGRGSLQDARALFRAALIDALPDLSLVGAGRIMGAIGSEKSAEVIQAAFDRVKAGLDVKPLAIPDADARGRVALEVGGARLVLSVHFNAQAELEAHFGGLSPDKIQRKLEDGASIVDVRAFFRAALIDDREVSLREAGLIMDRLGLVTASMAAAKAFAHAFPEAVPKGDGDQGNRQQRRAAGNPTKRRTGAGTGTRSPRSGRPKG